MSVAAPMTFLELVQRLAQEADVAGGAAAITATAAQTGEARRCVDWVRRSWLDIQGERHWSWMWERPQLTMLAATSTLDTGIQESRYLRDSLYLPAVGSLGQFPTFIPWDEFRFLYPFVQAGPTFGAWTIAPDGSIRVDIAPTGNVDFFVERYKLPTDLSGDTDVPDMPADLHMLIVWNAMVKYASFDEAGTQRATAVEEANRLSAQLRRRCLPVWRMGGPLGGE